MNSFYEPPSGGNNRQATNSFTDAAILFRFNLTRKDLNYLRTWRNDEGSPSSTVVTDTALKSESAAYSFYKVTQARSLIDWDRYVPTEPAPLKTFLRKKAT